MDKLESLGNEFLQQGVNNPFFKDKINRIDVTYEPKMFDADIWEARGFVNFKNNNTEGTHSFKGDTFDEVVLKMKSFIENLK